MLHVENLGEYEREAWQMTSDEKLASIPLLKEEGNKLFQKQDIKGASAKYHEAIARIEQLALRFGTFFLLTTLLLSIFSE